MFNICYFEVFLTVFHCVLMLLNFTLHLLKTALIEAISFVHKALKCESFFFFLVDNKDSTACYRYCL